MTRQQDGTCSRTPGNLATPASGTGRALPGLLVLISLVIFLLPLLLSFLGKYTKKYKMFKIYKNIFSLV